MSLQRTITVEGYFGKEKKITRNEFIQQWENHAKEFHKLVDYSNNDQVNKVHSIVQSIMEIAGDEFERIYKLQHSAKSRREVSSLLKSQAS